ncbi:MAG: hypothetical protein MI742_12675 [Desulfobacterales bacterium]|nr:hypothetical protein [Desulfobacterales bacterium]
MSGVDQLFVLERLRGNWDQPKKGRSEVASQPHTPGDESELSALFKKFKREIEAAWQGEKAEVLLEMHQRLEALAAEEVSEERNQAISELLDTMEILIDAYGITTS